MKAPLFATAPIVIERLPLGRKSLRLALVCDHSPPAPDANGLAAIDWFAALGRRDHEIQLVRPRQDGDELGAGEAGGGKLNFGFLTKRALVKQWGLRRPDIVCIGCEGALGLAALQAALKLAIPACTLISALAAPAGRRLRPGKNPQLAQQRKFHHKAQLTVVAAAELHGRLEEQGFRHLALIAADGDDPAVQLERLLLPLA